MPSTRSFISYAIDIDSDGSDDDDYRECLQIGYAPKCEQSETSEISCIVWAVFYLERLLHCLFVWEKNYSGDDKYFLKRSSNQGLYTEQI